MPFVVRQYLADYLMTGAGTAVKRLVDLGWEYAEVPLADLVRRRSGLYLIALAELCRHQSALAPHLIEDLIAEELKKVRPCSSSTMFPLAAASMLKGEAFPTVAQSLEGLFSRAGAAFMRPAIVNSPLSDYAKDSVTCAEEVRLALSAVASGRPAHTEAGLLQSQYGIVNPPPTPRAGDRFETHETFNIVVDPAISFREQVRRANYDSSDERIAEGNSNVARRTRRQIVVYQYSGIRVCTEAVIQQMTLRGDRPATIDDALAIGYAFPYRQMQSPIAFLDPANKYGAPTLGGGVLADPRHSNELIPFSRSFFLAQRTRDDHGNCPWVDGEGFAAIRAEESLVN
jgi:hypothetical protein